MASTSQHEEIFQREKEYLQRAQAIAQNNKLDHSDLKEEFVDLCAQYERLIGEAKIITSISDRLYHKLNFANEQQKKQSDQINKINQDLKVSNQILQDTVDQLVKAKVGRKAGTIVLTIAVALFILSEAYLEPFVESNTDNVFYGFVFKMGIAVILKPIDMIVDKYLMRQTLRKREMAYQM